MRRAVFAVVLVSCTNLACDRCGTTTTTTSAGAPAVPKEIEVELVTATGRVALDAKTKDAVRAHVEHALEICNFRSDAHEIPFKGMDLDAIWSARAAGPHLSVRYPAPHTFKALAGDVSATDVMLAMGTETGPEPALVRSGGKVIGLEMCGYDDRLLACAVPELSKALPPAGPCPPGYGPAPSASAR